MRETDGLIERAWRISPTLQRLELGVDQGLAGIQPGQIILAGSEQSYLRERWLPVETLKNKVVVELSTEQHYNPGQTVSLLAPVGSPLPWVGGRGKHLLLVAYDALPTPLLLLARQAILQGAEAALILMGQATQYPLNALPNALEVIHGNLDGTWPEQESILNWADQVFTVTNEVYWQDTLGAFLQTLKNYRTKVPVNYVYHVFSPELPCGTGACMACMVRCKTSNKLACTQGPALDLTEILLG